MTTETAPPPTTASQKMSRYRSVRRAQEQHLQPQSQDSAAPAPPVPTMPAVPEMPPQQTAPVSRSKSRYHRRPTESHATAPNLPSIPANTAQAQLPSQLPTQLPPQLPAQPVLAPAISSAARNRAVSSPQHTSYAPNTPQHRPRTAKQRSEASSSARQQQLKGDDAARELMQKERERQRVMREKYEAEAAERREARRREMEELERQQREAAEAARLKAQQEAEEAEALRRQKEEQKAEQERGKRLRKAESQKMQHQREEEMRRAKLEEKERRAKLEERTRNVPTVSPPISPPRQDAGLGLFKRRRDDGLSVDGPVKQSSPPRLSLSLGDREAETIRPGGGGAVLGIDAPTSAVNAGDRRVTVVCGKMRIQLPVTPTTTPLDLIKTAATILTEPIDVRTAAVSEHFHKVSITRPLRNYEYVRDVMNSWDYDTQNDLTIIDSQLDGIDQDDLLSYKVPDTRPEGMTCLIQYSSKPGKWSKRYLTLRPDGQLLMAKSEKPKEKDMENVCTLTDYDIYSLTQQKFAKIRPPKKICYVVKSMQKSNIFADESQYVHFFCTGDRATATHLYKAVQSWRSWYLKYQKGEGLKKKGPQSRNVSDNTEGQKTSSHTRGESVGSHYQLGAFSTLLDLDDFNKKLDAIEVHRPGEFPDDKPLARLDTKAMHARNKSLRVKRSPPNAFNLTSHTENTSQPNSRLNSMRQSFDQQEEETFAAGGLLGRTYTQRQAAQTREQNQTGPFTEGPSLLNGMGRMPQPPSKDSGLKRSTSVRSNHQRTSSDLQRSSSRRVPGMPEPLIDLTPQYRPPPQHANKGKGYNPGTSAGPLVESATSVEEAIKIPSSTDWRARPKTSRAGGIDYTRSLKGRGEPLAAYTQNNHSGAPEDDSNAFTGGGLLSQAGYSQGHAPVGRGVMDGSKARGPMISLDDHNRFASGSLLSALPNTNGPIIDPIRQVIFTEGGKTVSDGVNVVMGGAFFSIFGV